MDSDEVPQLGHLVSIIAPFLPFNSNSLPQILQFNNPSCFILRPARERMARTMPYVKPFKSLSIHSCCDAFISASIERYPATVAGFIAGF